MAFQWLARFLIVFLNTFQHEFACMVVQSTYPILQWSASFRHPWDSYSRHNWKYRHIQMKLIFKQTHIWFSILTLIQLVSLLPFYIEHYFDVDHIDKMLNKITVGITLETTLTHWNRLKCETQSHIMGKSNSFGICENVWHRSNVLLIFFSMLFPSISSVNVISV